MVLCFPEVLLHVSRVCRACVQHGVCPAWPQGHCDFCVCACTLRVPVSCVWLVHAVSVCVSISGPCVSCVHVEIFVSLVLGALPATSWTHCLYVMRQKWREAGGCLTLCLSPRSRSARGQWPTCFSRWSVGPMAAFSPLAT